MKYWQPIYNIAQLCSVKGLHHAILCPGSRSAPLVLAFARHPKINTRTFSDERSAAFIALGMAQQTNMPTILVCTSGSAAYNFAPAIAEAYFQQIPLLVFTADRPSEWIDQLDGQTIRQKNIYGPHVKKSYDLPQDYEHSDSQWQVNRIVNEAINLSQEFPKGPVHINAPFREPLYPAKDETYSYNPEVRVIESSITINSQAPTTIESFLNKLSSYTKVLIVAGQHDNDEKLQKSIEKFSKNHNSPVLAEIISNLHSVKNTIKHADIFLGLSTDSLKKSLQPELLITFGKSIISKQVKLFLRQHQPKEHWHIQPGGYSADTFQSLSHTIHMTAEIFFDDMCLSKNATNFEHQKRSNYVRIWEAEEHRIEKPMQTFFLTPTLGELHIVREIVQALPLRCNLHLANSMSVRYANIIGLEASKKGIHVFSNRGTSGIDGCSSTAVGHALSSEVPNFLITGDIAFFYDRNAYWHNYPMPNLHIMLLNNHGGVIFNMIDGPANLPESKEYFITNQRLSAKQLAAEFDFDYLKLDNLRKIKNTINDFFEFNGRTKVLEIETDADLNRKIVDDFRNTIKKEYEA